MYNVLVAAAVDSEAVVTFKNNHTLKFGAEYGDGIPPKRSDVHLEFPLSCLQTSLPFYEI